MIKSIKAIALLGDYYHQEQPLKELLQQIDAPVQWTFCTEVTQVPWENLSEYALFVLSRENRCAPIESGIVWMTASEEKRIEQFVYNGSGLLVLHSGLVSYGEDSDYTQLVGGVFLFHPPQLVPYQFYPLTSNKTSCHPILSEVTAYTINDELYFVARDPERSTLLGIAESPMYGSSAALWYAERGKGRIVGFTPAHTQESLFHPMTQKIIGNSIYWCSKVQPV
jgi:type 1 glutamine amidotransferase